MEAIAAAKSGDAEEARKKLQESGEELTKAHHYQTELIQNEAGGEKTEMTLLMVHAQDHLMNAMTVKDLAAEFIELYEKITEQRGASI
ncbi:EIIA-Lac [Bacillus subtilis]|nr:Lichenan-specific phosphotransferase enzyme IIA component [Bacillus subtilis]CAI6319176.1 EIIA-Lac [Bacillus subtilis]